MGEIIRRNKRRVYCRIPDDLVTESYHRNPISSANAFLAGLRLVNPISSASGSGSNRFVSRPKPSGASLSWQLYQTQQ